MRRSSWYQKNTKETFGIYIGPFINYAYEI